MLNATTMNQAQKKAAEHIKQLKDGKSAVEIAAEMYRENLPGKSVQTSTMMGQHVYDTVAEYYRSKTAALENYEAWVDEVFTTALSRMDIVQAYNQLYQIYVGAVAAAKLNTAATDEEKEEVQNWVKSEEARCFTDAEATPEHLAELKEKLAFALKDASLLTTQLGAMSETLRNAEASAQMVLDFGAINEDVMTLLAMQIYLDAKNGLLEDVPSNIRLEEVTLSVCSAMDTYRVAAQVANGEITEEEGAKLLGALGGVFGALLAIGTIYYAGMAVATVVTLTLGSSLIATVAGIVAMVAVSDPVFNSLTAAGTKVGNITQTLVVGTVKLVSYGLSMLFGAVAKGAQALWERINARKNELEAKNPAETETESAHQTAVQREAAEAFI